MSVNLLALCGDVGIPSVKRIRTTAAVQAKLAAYFEVLELSFRDGVEIERAYDSRWSPGPDEIITLQSNPEVDAILARLEGGVLALEELNSNEFEAERIRAILVQLEENGVKRLLIQSFSLSQRLSRKMALISNGNTFDKIDTSSFVLTNQLDIIVEFGLIKFKKYNVAKRIFDLSAHYKEATDAEIRLFAQNDKLTIDPELLIQLATQPLRKMISSVQASGVLDREDANSIRRKAAGLVPVVVENNRVVVPLTRAGLKDLMAFLDHKIYKSPVDEDSYETNSHRRRN